MGGSGTGTGAGAGEFLKVVVKNFDILAGPAVSLVYPLYASIRAIENKNPSDDQQWLTYWILHSMITLFELTFFKFIEWLPIWSYVKLILICWLVIPYFNGATFVYQYYVKPALANGPNINFSYNPWKKNIFGKREPDDILTAVQKYIHDNGTEVLEKLIHSHRDRADRNMSYSDAFQTDTYYADTYQTDTYHADAYYADTYHADPYYEDYSYRNFEN